MNLKGLILFLLAGTSTLFGQMQPGAVTASLAYSDISGYDNRFASFVNPAAIANIKSLSVSAFASPSPFGLNELATTAAAVNFSVDSASFAVSYLKYGFDLYNENRVIISHGRSFNRFITAGLSLEYRNLSIHNYGNTHAFNMIFGITVYPYKFLAVSGIIDNPLSLSYKNTSDQIPVIIRLGSAIFLSDLVKLTVALEDESDKSISIAYGAEIYLSDYFILRGGNNPGYNLLTAGAGIKYSGIGINYAILVHTVLNNTHQAEVYVQF